MLLGPGCWDTILFFANLAVFLPYAPLGFTGSSLCGRGSCSKASSHFLLVLFLVRCYLLYKCYTEAQVVRDRFLYPVVEKILHSRHPLVVWYVRIYECYQFCRRLKERAEFVLGIALLALR